MADPGPSTLPAYEAIEFPDPPPDRPYVLINMVMSLDGKTVLEGSEQGLGSEADQYLMRALRVHADVVLNGANTLRASGSSPLIEDAGLEARRAARGRPGPIGAIISASGDLNVEDDFFTSDAFDAVVFLLHDTPEDRREAIEATGRRVAVLPEAEPLPAMLRWMRDELDARVLLVEGGATLNGSLLDAGLVDELFVTVGGLIVGGGATLAVVASDREATRDDVTRLELVSAIPAPALDEVYLRYRVRRD
jgi:2,5-diamino-6-(ribosylamino)-4(3H)-pyrimidinone 5'-phosphate reductase